MARHREIPRWHRSHGKAIKCGALLLLGCVSIVDLASARFEAPLNASVTIDITWRDVSDMSLTGADRYAQLGGYMFVRSSGSFFVQVDGEMYFDKKESNTLHGVFRYLPQNLVARYYFDMTNDYPCPTDGVIWSIHTYASGSVMLDENTSMTAHYGTQVGQTSAAGYPVVIDANDPNGSHSFAISLPPIKTGNTNTGTSWCDRMIPGVPVTLDDMLFLRVSALTPQGGQYSGSAEWQSHLLWGSIIEHYESRDAPVYEPPMSGGNASYKLQWHFRQDAPCDQIAWFRASVKESKEREGRYKYFETLFEELKNLEYDVQAPIPENEGQMDSMVIKYVEDKRDELYGRLIEKAKQGGYEITTETVEAGHVSLCRGEPKPGDTDMCKKGGVRPLCEWETAVTLTHENIHIKQAGDSLYVRMCCSSRSRDDKFCLQKHAKDEKDAYDAEGKKKSEMLEDFKTRWPECF